MTPDNLIALAIFGTTAVALLAGLGAWVYEFLQNRRPELPEKGDDILGAALPPAKLYQGSIRLMKPASTIVPTPPASIGLPKPPPPVFSPPIKPEPKQPTTNLPTAPQKSDAPTESTSWAKSFPSFSKFKKQYSEKISEPSPDLPKAVKTQSSLPDFGGMCNKCGEKPKVPGNDGFCSDCSELG